MDEKYLIEKWLNNELNESEKQAFSEMDDAAFNMYIVDNAHNFKASHFTKQTNFETFKQLYHSQNKPVKKLNWVSPFLKIASVIVIAFGLYFTFFNNNEIVVETLASEKTTIELPDHSIVDLNAKSTISYYAKNWDDNRALNLQGEAYFKVAKGKTFDVKTKQGLVTVVGTQFNVKQRDNYFEVKCFEGIVKVSSNAITKQLLAGDTFLMINGKFSEGKTKMLSPGWMDDMSEFETIPLKEVFAELERQYNIQITAKNTNLNRLFTGGFMHDNLENALIAITQPMNLTYKFTATNQVIINDKGN